MEKMVLSSFESGCLDHNDSSDVEFLRDIEEISKALYVENKTQENSVVSYANFGPKSVSKLNFVDMISKRKHGFDNSKWVKEEQKHSSIWGWKPLRALSHLRQRKFSCYFFCHVHCIENLMMDFSDLSMCVNWKRKDSVTKTLPSRVTNGMVEFEETLMSKCNVYGGKSGSGDFVKYEPKHFLLYASIVEAEGLEIGKHWVDLTRLLPLTLEELEQDNCSGKWSTSFKLVGKAKGATLHVSFGFLVTKDSLAESVGSIKPSLVLSLEQNGLSRMSFADSASVRDNSTLRRMGSVPSSLTNASCYSSQCLDAKIDWPKDAYDFSNSINMLYGKLEEGSIDSSTKIDVVFEHLESLKLVLNSSTGSVNDFTGAKHDDVEFTVIEKGVESECFPQEATKLKESIIEDLGVSDVEVIDIAEIFKGEELCSDNEINIDRIDDEAFDCSAKDAPIDKYSVTDIKESNLEKAALDLLKLSEDKMSVKSKVKHTGINLVKSLSLDDFAKAVVDDFCSLIQATHTPSTQNLNVSLESPRERLLRQFEEDMMTSRSLFLDVGVQHDMSEYEYAASRVSSPDYNVESVDLPPVIDIAGFAANGSVQESSRNKLKAKSLERLETQTLMQKWGLDEEAFQSSPHYSTGGFGSPIFIPPEEPFGLPPLAEGLEPLLQLKNGGCLRSMSPLLFTNAKNCGSLIMQTSKTLVLPTELGSDIMDILQCLASVGSERLSKKLCSLMPLEDLSGKIMQQLAWEAAYEAEVLKRPTCSQHESDIKIEVEGYWCVQRLNYFSLSSTSSDIGSEYVAAKDLALLVLDSVESLMIEGLKIQSGVCDRSAPSCIRAKSASEVRSQLKIDYDKSSDFLGVKGSADYVNGLLDLAISLDEWLRLDADILGDKNTENKSRKFGLLGDHLTLALMLQLRDPLRNYEPVGGPMLGLIQVTRLIELVNKPNYSWNSKENTNTEEETNRNMENDKEGQQDMISGFTLNGVHVAGLNAEPDDLESWSSRRQQQSGSRWLLASGLNKNDNTQFSKSRSIMRMPTLVLRKPWARNFIWSISCPIHEVEDDSPTRNPDIIFPQDDGMFWVR